MKSQKTKFSTSLIFLWVVVCVFVLYLTYRVYLIYPQRFENSQCIKHLKTNEIYRVITPAHRDISFKGNWFFGPMIIDIQVFQSNPNTNRAIRDKMIFTQDDRDLAEVVCP